ncbi:MAG: hypothetical protein PVJ57_09390 [Phycisphaerae bacterium]|jgi:hypothetical protein
MAVFMAEYLSSRLRETLVPGVPGKIIVVTRVCVATGGSGTFKLLSDPSGPDERDVLKNMQMAANTTLDLVFGRRYGLSADRGKALALTDSFGLPSGAHTITVWYELVD